MMTTDVPTPEIEEYRVGEIIPWPKRKNGLVVLLDDSLDAPILFLGASVCISAILWSVFRLIF